MVSKTDARGEGYTVLIDWIFFSPSYLIYRYKLTVLKVQLGQCYWIRDERIDHQIFVKINEILLFLIHNFDVQLIYFTILTKNNSIGVPAGKRSSKVHLKMAVIMQRKQFFDFFLIFFKLVVPSRKFAQHNNTPYIL